MLAVRTEGLTKAFERRLGRERTSHVAVAGIDLQIEQGEAVAFIGPNGAGKSTTIKMLTGILHPSSGAAEVLGLVPWQQRQRLALQIGTVFGQRSQLWFHLPAGDTLRLLGAIYELPADVVRRRSEELVERFALGELLTVPVRKLSLGQRMRFEIAASLLHQPRVLFLDEPTVGLDPQTRTLMWEDVLRMRDEEGVTIFLTTHYMDEAEHADRIAIIDHGAIVALDTPDALKHQAGQDSVELRTADDTVARDRLASAGFDVRQGDEALVVFTSDGEARVPELIATAGVAVRNVHVHRPTLDDVFLHYTGRQIREDHAERSTSGRMRAFASRRR